MTTCCEGLLHGVLSCNSSPRGGYAATQQYRMYAILKAVLERLLPDVAQSCTIAVTVTNAPTQLQRNNLWQLALFRLSGMLMTLSPF
jgi:hypothetical protein